ncbi:MAG: amidohydrolase [Pseudonocardiales bacterium]|nr:MAG: amidohydrolase [Pseudonocardiales bacterium]PZS29168.1 MAG: amidohydrolase [Pseudonocardiales bacterium]
MSGPLLLRGGRPGVGASPADIAIRDGHIVAIGEAAGAQGESISLDGRIVLPGLWDRHVHAAQWALTASRIDLRAARSAQDAAHRLGAVPVTASVVRGIGFADATWPDRPHKSLLEAAAPGRAILAQSNDLHTAWFSPAALALIGLDHPTGVLRDGESYLAVAALPQPSAADADRSVLAAMAAAAARGVTGVVDFEYDDNVAAWARRAGSVALPVRVEASIPAPLLDAAIGRGLRAGSDIDCTAGRAVVGPVKAFGDGSLNTRTAWCYNPYTSGEAGHAGGPDATPAELRRLVGTAAAHGLTCAIHAIGDRAMSAALDAFEAAAAPGRIEHAQLVAIDDLPRLWRPGLVLGVQPAHQPDDRDVADRFWAGATDRAYAYRTMLTAGATIEFGSDAPVAPLDPWDGIAAAVHRSDDHRPPWHPEQALRLDVALAASSRGRTGIAVGDVADLAILDVETLGSTPTALRATPVWATLLAGSFTHRTPA